jgi:hypothetical protein
MTFKFSFIILALPLFAVTGSQAQVGSPAKAAGIQFRTLGCQMTASELYYDNAGKSVKIDVPESCRSAFYQHATAATIDFYRLVPDEKGVPVKKPVARAEIGAAGKWPLLVFLADSVTPDAIRIVAMADDLEAFPAPNFRFINLTAVPLTITLDKDHHLVPPRNMELFDPKLNKADSVDTRYTTITAQTDHGPYQIYSNNWVVRPTQRTLVFIGSRDSALEVQRIVDDTSQYAPSPSK